MPFFFVIFQICSFIVYSLNRKRRGHSRYLLSVDVQIDAASGGEEVIPVKLVYMRNRSNRKDYLVLLSTDTTLTEDEIIQLYGKRWDIEVFFKACKSILRLTKECRSICYDAMCAQTAIVFLKYMFLAVGIRENADLRTAGPMFCLAADELSDISFAQAFEKLQLFLEKLLEEFHVSEQTNSAFVTDFVSGLPTDIAHFLPLNRFCDAFLYKSKCEV